MTQEELDEWRQDLLDEARQEELHEHLMRTDFDAFCDYYADDIALYVEARNFLKRQLENYDWEPDLDSF